MILGGPLPSEAPKLGGWTHGHTGSVTWLQFSKGILPSPEHPFSTADTSMMKGEFLCTNVLRVYGLIAVLLGLFWGSAYKKWILYCDCTLIVIMCLQMCNYNWKLPRLIFCFIYAMHSNLLYCVFRRCFCEPMSTGIKCTPWSKRSWVIAESKYLPVV